MFFLQGMTQLRWHVMRVKPNKKFQVTFKRWQIVKGDEVQIRAGNDRGKVGKVMRVFRKSNAVTVSGINMRLKHFSIIFINL